MHRKLQLVIAILAGISAAIGLAYVYYGRNLDETYRFGVVVGNSKIEHVFSVPNFTPRALAVEDVHTSCGCTVVDELPRIVEPFSNLKVPVRMDITQKSGLTTSEVFVKFSEGRTAKFRLEATVYQPLPERVNFGEFKQGDTLTKSYMGSSIRTLCEYKPIPGVRVQHREVERSPIVDITITPEFNAFKNFSIRIPFYCANREVPALYIEGYVKGLVETEKPLVSLGYVSTTGPAIPATVKFYSPYDKPFRWRNDQTKYPGWVSLAQSERDNTEIEFKLTPPLQEGILSDTIDIHFDVENQEEVVVPVTVLAYVTSDSLQ